jgi:hypothetical protein
MQTQQTKPSSPRDTNSRRGWLVAAAAFAAVILVLGVTLVLARASDTEELQPATDPDTPTTSVAPTTTQVPATTTPPAADLASMEADAVQIAEQALAAFGGGDVDAFFADFDPVAMLDVSGVTEPGVQDEYAFWIELEPEITSQQCDVKAETLDFTGGPLDTPRFVVNCEIRLGDALGGPAGYAFNGTYQFTVSAGQIIEHRISVPAEERLDPGTDWESARDVFSDDMAAWLKEAHPDVWTSVFALAEPCGFEFNCRPSVTRRGDASPGKTPGEWLRSAATATALLEYRDEFIAQSEDYPLGQ